MERERREGKSTNFFYTKQSFAIFPQNRYKKDAYIPKTENAGRQKFSKEGIRIGKEYDLSLRKDASDKVKRSLYVTKKDAMES